MAAENETTADAGLQGEGVEQIGMFFSPEAIIMFSIAISLDSIGVILVCFGLDDFGITDIVGIATIGLWTYMRSQTMKVTRGAAQRITKATKQAKRTIKSAKWAKRLKWLRPLLVVGELIPYVGILPCWVVLVYLELKYS